MPSRLTIQMLADELGVHVSTVSRALDPRASGELSTETVARIRELARKRGYEPNPWARSLRTQETRMIGLLMPRLTDSVLAAMFEAAEDRARDHGYQAVTLSTRDRYEEEQRLVDALLDRRVDGLILATAVLDDPVLPALERDGIKFVLLNRTSDPYPSVHGDDEAGGYIAARHLLGQGHQRVAMIAGPPNVSTASSRLSGYRRAHEALGVPVDPQLVVASMFSAHDGVEAATKLLAMRHRPTAIFAVNDSTAIGAMAVARDLNLRVPDDLAIVGYNDTDLAPLLPVPLSSIAVPIGEMGRTAVDVLIAHLSGTDEAMREHVFQPRLIARSSSLFQRTNQA